VLSEQVYGLKFPFAGEYSLWIQVRSAGLCVCVCVCVCVFLLGGKGSLHLFAEIDALIAHRRFVLILSFVTASTRESMLTVIPINAILRLS